MPSKSTTVVPMTSSLFRKGERAYTVKMPLADLHRLSINNRYEHQRPEDLRTEKPHVNTWGARHHVFAVLAWPNGELTLIDGYTRLLCIRQGRLAVPADVLANGAQVFVHSVETPEEAFSVYESYNSKDSAKTAAEYLIGALSANNAAPSTKWLRCAKGLSSAIRIAFEGVRIADKSGIYRRNSSRLVKVATFAEAIKLFDSISPDIDRFPAGFLAGALLAIYRDGKDALEFFDRYNNRNYITSDQAWHLSAALDMEREQRTMASTHPDRHISIVLGCYSSWKKNGLKTGGRPKAKDRAEFVLNI